MIQGSPEWFASRCGKVTASRISDVMAKIKSGEAAGRRNYRAQLVAERLIGVPAESFSNAAMQWGNDQEPFARAAYEIHSGNIVEEVGFVDHPSIEMTGASPDGLVGDDGLVEIKCPNTATHISYCVASVVPSDYILQMLWQMECTGRQWCDFISYDPRLPENMQTFCRRLIRDDAKIAEIRAEVVALNKEIESTVIDLKYARYWG